MGSEKVIFDFYFLIVHISIDNVLYGLNLWAYVGNIRFERTVSQILVYIFFVFFFMQKNG